MPLKEFKIVMVGDSGVGKTQTIVAVVTNSMARPIPFRVWDPAELHCSIGNVPCKLIVHDTSEGEEYNAARKSACIGADAIMIFYSSLSEESLESIRTKWYPEISYGFPSTPIFIIWREWQYSRAKIIATAEQGEALAKELGVPFLRQSYQCEFRIFETVMITLLESKSQTDPKNLDESNCHPVLPRALHIKNAKNAP